MNHNIEVPAFKQYYSSEDQMDSLQRSFYRKWQEKWDGGVALDVQGNISYLFCYTNKVLFLGCRAAISHLQKLIDAYTKEKYFVDYCKLWMSDCYVMLGDYRQALEVFPTLDANSRGSTCTDELLSLRIQNDEHIKGRDILTLNGPRVTAWGKAHLDLVAFYLEVILRAYEQHNKVNLLESWKTHVDYPVFCSAETRESSSLFVT
jgi:hypothetical protein